MNSEFSTKKQLSFLIKLSLPAVLSQMAQMGMGFIDTIMAGRHSKDTLAVVSVGSNLFIPVIIFVLGVFLSINPLTSGYSARGESSNLARIFKSSIWLAAVISIPIFFIVRNLEPAIHLLGLNEELSQAADDYLEALSYGVLPLFLFLGIRFFNEGLFSTRAIMVITLSALPLNVIFNYLFLFKMEMGPAGLGYATTIAYCYLFLAMMFFSLKYKGYSAFQAKLKIAKIDFAIIKNIIKLGLPIGIGLTLEVTLFAVTGLFIALFGIATIAGHQIAMNIASMTFMMPMGISIATTARVGYFYGKSDYSTASKIGYMGTALSLLVMTLSAITMWTFPDVLVGFYTDDPNTVKIAISLLFFAAIFQLFDGIQVTVLGALRGFHDTKVPMYLNLIAYWLIGFPIGYYFSRSYQASGFWMGIILALTSAAILMSIRYRWVCKKYQIQTQLTSNIVESKLQS